MAKLQHTFIKGKMNKDLDERLIPNGEYRDASNVQVSTSEGADVGAVENIIGNTKLNKKTNAVNWDPLFGLTDPVCIGTIRDSQNNKIYWFLATDPDGADYKSIILEFDQSTGFIAPILVDTNNVINFTKENLITGINILEGLLFFTDNTSEPKVINIARFKAGSQQTGTTITTQTVIYGGPMTLETVTVIIDTPETVLTATAVPSLIGGSGTGITPITTTAVNFGTKVVTDVVNVAWSANQGITPALWTNKKAVLIAQVIQEDETVDKYQVTGQFLGTIATLNADLTIDSISSDTPNTALEWSLLLIEDEPIFKNDFPRFSYRYKYTDARYSTYAPFSLATFVPSKFEYLSRDGFNEGMDNHTRKITIGNFPTLPPGVISIEILYKGSRSTNVYIIETFLATDTLSLEITSSVLGPIVESSQLLRLFDNVPRKALAQEIIGNRVVYGNYLQNNNVTEGSINLTAFAINTAHLPGALPPFTGLPSVKTDRDYQLGVSFLDEFGRESPVFTTNTATVSFDQVNASKVNKIEPVLSSTTPALSTNGGWATHFKYYIKNNTPEYYNIALDRFYNSEDGSVWLSFPSAERNKVSEGQYIRLKKQHDTSVPVTVNNRYKINGIENEAPDYLTNVQSVIARVSGLTVGNGTSSAKGFILGSNRVKFRGPTRDNNENFFNSFGPDSFIQFLTSSGGGRSAIYSILEGGPNGAQETITSSPASPKDGVYNIFELTLAEGIKAGDVWLTNFIDETEIKIVIYEKVQRPLPEFQGRFFVKINPDAAFVDNVQAAFSDAVPALVLDTKLELEDNSSGYNVNSFIVAWNFTSQGLNIIPPLQGADNFRLFAANYVFLQSNAADPKARKFTDDFSEGAIFKFEYNDGSASAENYTVISKQSANFNPALGLPSEKGEQWTYTLDRVIDDAQLPTSGPPYVLPTRVQIFRERIIGDQEKLSSQNPAVFETESDELADIDLYYEVSDVLPASQAGVRNQFLNWFNCYSFGNGVESDRIRDDYNATVIGKGVRVSSVLNEPYAEERLGSQMIFSGIFNSISGINNTNQFLTAENITKTLNPIYGTIQKLYARDTDLIVLMEDKCFRVLADKDALFNADGSSNVALSNRVLGSVTRFVGEFGISTNPESFASFGFRSYFVDKSRGAIMRLSRDGLTKISSNGMSDYFIDNLKLHTTGNITGSYDSDAGSYNVCINVPTVGSEPNKTESVAFKEKVNGWTTTMSYVPEAGTSLNNEYYTFKSGEIWEHSNETRSNFYGAQFNSTVTPIINDAPTSVKKFKTLAYEGTAGWRSEIVTDQQNGEVPVFVKKEGSFYNYIQGIDTTVANLDTQEFSTQGLGSLLLNAPIGTSTIVINGAINVSLQANPQNPGGGAAGVAALDTIYTMSPGNTLRIVGTVIGINRTTNTITLAANIAGSALQAGDFVFFGKDTRINTSGIIGYYAETKMITTDSTKEELFSISSEVFISSE